MNGITFAQMIVVIYFNVLAVAIWWMICKRKPDTSKIEHPFWIDRLGTNDDDTATHFVARFMLEEVAREYASERNGIVLANGQTEHGNVPWMVLYQTDLVKIREFLADIRAAKTVEAQS